MRQKFTHKHRLKNKSYFAAVFVKKLKIRFNCCLVLYQPNQIGYPRLGMIIKKRIVRKAHDRNHIKRIVRESFRKHIPILGGLDLILILNDQYQADKFFTLQQELKTIWLTCQQKLLLA